MTKTKEEIKKESLEEIEKFKKLIQLTQEIIEITKNKDRYGNENYLSDFKNELSNHIETYEFSINLKMNCLIILKLMNFQ